MEINAKAKKPVRPRVTAKQKKKEAVEKEQNAVEEQPSAKVVTPNDTSNTDNTLEQQEETSVSLEWNAVKGPQKPVGKAKRNVADKLKGGAVKNVKATAAKQLTTSTKRKTKTRGAAAQKSVTTDKGDKTMEQQTVELSGTRSSRRPAVQKPLDKKDILGLLDSGELRLEDLQN